MERIQGPNKRAGGMALGIDRFDYAPQSHRSSWMVSYADMMTIILTFFILLLSISTIARTKYDLLVQAFTGTQAGNLQEVKEEIDRVIEEQTLGGEIETTLGPDGLAISFSNALLFPSGDAELTERGKTVFGPIEKHLVDGLEPIYGVVVEGYTDDVPISNAHYPSNWELSASRGIHVMQRLVDAGLDRRRVSIQAFADTRAATEVDLTDIERVLELEPHILDEARAANRRVVIRVYELPQEVKGRLLKPATANADSSEAIQIPTPTTPTPLPPEQREPPSDTGPPPAQRILKDRDGSSAAPKKTGERLRLENP